MDALKQLDALCLASIVADAPVTFSFGGVDYVGTTTKRESLKEAVPGGFLEGVDDKLTVEFSQFGTATPPAEREKISICVDVNGNYCHVDEAVGSRKTVRINGVARSCGGISYTLGSEVR